MKNKKQLSLFKGSAVFSCALLLLMISQFAHSALSVAIDSVAYLSSVEVPGPVSAQVRVNALLNNFNNANLSFDQTQLALKEGVSSPLRLTVKNTGINDLNNATVIITLPADVVPTFLSNSAYTIIQLPDGTWLLTLSNPLLPNDVVNIDVVLDVASGAPDAASQIIAEFFANGVSIVTQSVNAVIGTVKDGLFLTHQIDKATVISDDVVTYTLTLTNQLPITINNINLTNILPIGVRFINKTVKFNNLPVVDPVISKDGMSLTFNIGTLAKDEVKTISYSAYISSVARSGELKNISYAKGDGANSNTANAATILRKDAINIDSHIVGRVLVDNCTVEDADSVGNQSLRLSSYLVDDGLMYKINAEGSGAPINNYHVSVSLPKSKGDNKADKVDAYHVNVLLPDVFSYVKASVLIDGKPSSDAVLENGYLVINLGDQPSDWKHEITFKVKPDDDAIGLYETSVFGEYLVQGNGVQRTESLVNTYQSSVVKKHYRTFTYWPRFKSLDYTLQPADITNIDNMKQLLKGEAIEHITVIGHSDNQVIHGAGLKKVKDNAELSRLRAQSLATHLQGLLGIESDKFSIIGKGDMEPVADNATEAGRAKNRRVELLVEVVDESKSKSKWKNNDKQIELGKEKTTQGSLYTNVNYINHKESVDSKGLQNIRLLMEDGRFVDTDDKGRYHFEALKTGTHVIQIDPTSIPEDYEPYLCENNTRFAQTPTSRFVDIQPGLIWRANFHLKKIVKASGVATALKLKSQLNNNVISYRLHVSGPAFFTTEAKVQIEMPKGINILADSAMLNDKKVILGHDNQTWFLVLDKSDAAWVNELTFNAEVDAATPGDYATTASLLLQYQNGDNHRSSVVSNVLTIEKPTSKVERYDIGAHFISADAELAESDKTQLDDLLFLLKDKQIEKVDIIGYIDADENTTAIDADNLSLHRAQALADYIKNQIDVSNTVINVLANSKNISESKYTDEERAKNHRIEIFVSSKIADPTILTQLSKPESILRIDNIKAEDASDVAAIAKAVANANLPQGILSLAEGDVIANASAAIRINVDSRLQQELYVDDKLVPESRIGFRSANNETNQTIYTYFGVRLGEPGEHILRLKGLDPFGNARLDQSIKYFRSGEIKTIQFISADDNIADGKTPVVAKIELLDESGKKINAAAALRIVDGTLQPLTDKGFKKVPLLDNKDKMLEVDKDGLIQFNPVTKSGLYRMKVQYNNIETVLKIYVKPEIRDWVMVGLADGVLGYNDVSGNAEAIDSSNIDDNYYNDGKLAFYAKGRVLGKYLLTVAYDSSKKTTQDDRLLQMIDPDEYYTLYGDETEQQFDAASRKKLYVRLDADNFYALFGDYNTDLTVTELSRYSRSLTGAKVVYESDSVSVNAFAASTNQSFARDEILGDGTSGLYYLSKKDIVINSEKITIQVRDRFHSDRIISEQSLNRFSDYNFDYASGTVYFKQPISRHDDDFNPIYIVVEYESHGTSGKESIISGGRAAVKLANDNVELGVTHIDEGVQGNKAELTGVDARFDITKTLELKTEYANTRVSQLATLNDADAYLAELLHKGDKIESSVYIREQEEGFGLGQLNQSEEGTRKYGAKTNAILKENLEFRGDIGHEDNLTNNASRNLLLGNVVYSPKDWEFNVGATIAADKDINGDSYQSDMLNTGISHKLLDDKLRLYTRSDWQLNNGANSLDYPERHILGSEYTITDDVNIYSEYEYAFGNALKSESTRAGLRSVPWENASMHNGIQYDTSDAEARTFAVFGLTQAVPFADNWRASFSYDETKTINKKLYERVNNNTPLASGSSSSFSSTNGVTDEDFWATTAGLGYQSELYLFDSRIEYREAETQNKYGMFAAWQRNLVDGVGHALRWQGFITDDKLFGEQLDTQLRYSLVVRPLGSDVFWFNRLELKHADITNSLNDNTSNRLVEHLAINYVPLVNWQIATHIGYKYVRTDLSSTVFSTQTYLLGNETRYDLTSKWDIGAHYHIITTPASGITEDSYGVSVGVDLAKNLWLSIGYNIEGYYDEDFDANGYTAQGAFLKLRFKFDQDTFNLNESK